MTTHAAASAYEAMHIMQNRGKGFAVFNPHNKPLEDLPVIYGFNAGGDHKPGYVYGNYLAVAIAQDGTQVGSHGCSAEAYMPSDLCCIGNAEESFRHKDYVKHYPEGYRMEFVSSDQKDSHEGLQEALKKHQELRARESVGS